MEMSTPVTTAVQLAQRKKKKGGGGHVKSCHAGQVELFSFLVMYSNPNLLLLLVAFESRLGAGL